MTSNDILIVDDEADIRSLIRGILEDEGYSVRDAESSEQAYKAVAEKKPSLVILDIWLQGSQDDGLDILKKLKDDLPELPFIMISGHGTIETAVSAIKDGAYDFIEKPFKADRLLMMITRALENARLIKENATLKKSTVAIKDDLIGDSAALQNVRQLIEKAAPSNSRILIKGEAGAGKDVVARLIHKNSLRADEVFMALNCATLHPDRLELELFGSEGDGPDGQEYIGVLERAHGGTLLLDEVADMPLETQGKIVRVLQEQKFQRLGGQNPIEVDVRVLATSNRDLEAVIEKGDFREDLYYRLNVVKLEVPALRERSEDVSALANTFLQTTLKQFGHAERTFSQDALHALKRFQWPGNVRQLKNVIEWVSIMHGGSADIQKFEEEHLPPEITGAIAHSGGKTDEAEKNSVHGVYLDLSLKEAREQFEREYLLSQIERFEGNVSKTAQFIGMERSALHRKMKSLDVQQDQHRDNTVDAETKRKRA